MIRLKGYKIFISSPRDLKGDRSRVKEIIHLFNLSCFTRDKVIFIPIDQDDVAGGHGNAQTIINKDSSDRDFIIVMFGKTLGERTEKYRSGTIEEYEISKQLLVDGKMINILVLFKDVSRDLKEDEHKDYVEVIEYKQEAYKDGFCKEFVDNYTLSNQVNSFLSKRGLATIIGEVVQAEEDVKASDVKEPSEI